MQFLVALDRGFLRELLKLQSGWLLPTRMSDAVMSGVWLIDFSVA
jgi:hypothetical protein